jgi:glycosyltransferase involved in cell wall biosynthesis
MKLLICTQAVDTQHSNLALFHRWIEEFAKHCEEISVICLYEGTHSLPPNVRIYSLGKEKNTPRFVRWINALRYSLTLGAQHDAVFVHMNPEYVVLGGWWWRLRGKKIALWYTHKSVDLKLRIAALFATVICTASAKSFRLRSTKVRVMGHGIDTVLFSPKRHASEGVLHVATVGRISKTKQILEMVYACKELQSRNIPFVFSIAGAPLLKDDMAYEQSIVEHSAGLPVQMLGAVPYEQLHFLLANQDVFLNLSLTGSVDRAVLEAAAMGVVPVTSNEAFKDMLEPYGLYVARTDPTGVADAIVKAQGIDVNPLTAYVRKHHSLEKLIPNIIASLS